MDIGTNKSSIETNKNTRGKDGERSEGVRSVGVRGEGVRAESVKRIGRGGRKAGLSLKKQQLEEKEEEQKKGRQEKEEEQRKRREAKEEERRKEREKGRGEEGEEEVVWVSQPRTRQRDRPPLSHTE